MSFRDNLAAAKASLDSGDRVKTPPIPAVVDGVLHEVIFYRASPSDWAHATLASLPRPDVVVDIRNGYNLTDATRAIAPGYGRVIDDGEELTLTAEEWADFFTVIPPATGRMIEANVWTLNEHDPEQEIERLKKASRAGSKKKSSSPAK